MARAVEVAGRRGCSKGANAEREREREREGEMRRWVEVLRKNKNKVPDQSTSRPPLLFLSCGPLLLLVPLVTPLRVCIVLQMRALASATSSPWKLWRKSNSKCTGHAEAYFTRKAIPNLPSRETYQRARTRPTEWIQRYRNVADTSFHGGGCYKFRYASGIGVFEIFGT